VWQQRNQAKHKAGQNHGQQRNQAKRKAGQNHGQQQSMTAGAVHEGGRGALLAHDQLQANDTISITNTNCSLLVC
jgi:hypothetical protein